MSLKKIAQMVGTTPSTVSRVLNNAYQSCASSELKDKIWAAAQELNYVPNSNARNLKKGSKEPEEMIHISVLFTRLDTSKPDPFFLELSRHIKSDLFANHCILDQIGKADATAIAKSASSDGILLLGRCSETLLTKLKAANRNLVGIWRNPTNFDIDEVVCDGKKAAILAMEHLIQLGHTNIGYIGDCSYESRYVGYCDALISHNLPINYPLIIPTHQTEAEGYDGMLKLLQEPLVTAVLCANDATAIGALKALKKQKKRTLSVISIDNIEEAQSTNPLLTTVNIPREDMAHMAIYILLDRIRRKHTEHIRIEFPCRIVSRDSCY